MWAGTSTQEVVESDKDWFALRLENEVLRTLGDTSRDALFFKEFPEPVDLIASEPEIIRQVFDNECVWRLCDTAITHLYKLRCEREVSSAPGALALPAPLRKEDFQAAVMSSRSHKEQVKEFERALIDNAIDLLGSKRKAARALGAASGTIVRKTQGGPSQP